MNKNLKAFLITIAIISFVGIIVYFLLKPKKQKTESNPILGGSINEPLPAAQVNTNVTEPVATESGLGASLIRNRMIEIYNNNGALENVINTKSVPIPDLSGTKYPAGIARTLNDSGFQSVPVVPNFMSPSYQAEIKNFLNQPDFESVARSNFDAALSTYQNAMNFSSVRFYPFPAFENVVKQDGFGKPGKADKNRSERYDAGIKDFKVVFSNTLDANKKLEEAIKAQAIQDLRDSGYKFIGFDV